MGEHECTSPGGVSFTSSGHFSPGHGASFTGDIGLAFELEFKLRSHDPRDSDQKVAALDLHPLH
jgi:hypothetical protein